MADTQKKTENTEEKIDKAIGILLDQVRANLKPEDQLRQTQAVLNMAHARAQLLGQEKTQKKSGAGA